MDPGSHFCRVPFLSNFLISCHAGSWVWVATPGITTFSAAGAARALQQAVFIRVANRTLENPYGAPRLEIL